MKPDAKEFTDDYLNYMSVLKMCEKYGLTQRKFYTILDELNLGYRGRHTDTPQTLTDADIDLGRKFQKYSVSQLKDMCRELKLARYSTQPRKVLIRMLDRAGVDESTT